MWPIRKRATNQSKAQTAIALFPDAVSHVAGEWLGFNEVLKFKKDVPLEQIIFVFSVPAFEGLRLKFLRLREAPESLLLMIVAMGVEKSGTHSRLEIEKALGAKLPS